MARKRYDLMFSLGASCAGTQALRHADLQFSSFPFDWLGGSSLNQRVDLICRNLDGFLDDEKLDENPILNRYEVVSEFGPERLRVDKYGFRYAHDFPRGVSTAEYMPKVREKYVRRMMHLDQLASKAGSILVIWVDVLGLCPEATLEDLRRTRELLMRKWPQAQVDVIAFKHREGLDPAQAEVVDEAGVRRVYFHLKDDLPEGVWMARIPPVTAFMKAHYEAVDYRTPAERRERKRQERLKRYQKFGATSYLGFLWGRMEVKLYKHLTKKLTRLGVI